MNYRDRDSRRMFSQQLPQLARASLDNLPYPLFLLAAGLGSRSPSVEAPRSMEPP